MIDTASVLLRWPPFHLRVIGTACGAAVMSPTIGSPRRLALLPLAELLLSLFRGRHAAVEDHASGQPDCRMHIPVLADNALDMGEAEAAGVLNAPCLPGGRPLDFRP